MYTVHESAEYGYKKCSNEKITMNKKIKLNLLNLMYKIGVNGGLRVEKREKERRSEHL